jgi:hypothetical protein
LGPFRLTPGKRLLEKEGLPVAIGSRALDILITLVNHAGDPVAIGYAIAEAERRRTSFDMPEMLRLKASLLMDASPDKAEELLISARHRTQTQGSLAWGLRIIMTRAELQSRRGHGQMARDELSTILQQFTEGTETIDRQKARTWLEQR